jgi:hypothetical protein
MGIGVITVTTKKFRKIRLLGLALIMVGLIGSNAFALDMLGPPSAELESGIFSGGIEYASSKMDLKLIEGTSMDSRNGELPISGTLPSQTIDDFEVSTLYATAGYGIVENYEVFLRMGLANSEFGDTLWEEGEDFDGKNDFAMGGGFKATFYEGFDWKVGGIFQVNWTELDGELDASAWEVIQPHYVEISSTEMQIAVGVTYLRSSWLSIYGGPFMHFISGDFDYKFTKFGEDFVTSEVSYEFNEGPTYGGYIGAQIKLFENGFGNVEYQQTSDAEVVGAGLLLRY